MAGAAVSALAVPGRYTRFLKNPLQLLAPMQWLVHGTAARAQQTVRSQAQPSVPAERFAAVERERRMLESRLASAEAQLEELRQQVAAVGGWRARGLGPNVRVLPARTTSGDAVGWCESMAIDVGSADGVAEGDWVVSHSFLPSAGQGGQAGVELLMTECLLGRVVETSPFVSRVLLLTDTDPHRRQRTLVRVARLEEDRLAGPADDFVLYGLGGSQMSVPDVPAQLHKTGKIRAGDLVISSPNESRLPLSLVIGQVDRIEPDRRNPLVVHLFVSPRMELSSVRRVYVMCARRGEG